MPSVCRRRGASCVAGQRKGKWAEMNSSGAGGRTEGNHRRRDCRARVLMARLAAVSRLALQQSVELVAELSQFVEVAVVEGAEALGEAGDSGGLELEEGLFAGVGEDDVHLAFVAGVDAALN